MYPRAAERCSNTSKARNFLVSLQSVNNSGDTSMTDQGDRTGRPVFLTGAAGCAVDSTPKCRLAFAFAGTIQYICPAYNNDRCKRTRPYSSRAFLKAADLLSTGFLSVIIRRSWHFGTPAREMRHRPGKTVKKRRTLQKDQKLRREPMRRRFGNLVGKEGIFWKTTKT